MKLSSLLPAFGAGSGRRPRRVGVREAWLDPDRYAGQAISLVGVVCVFGANSPTPYFTLDDGPNRIGLHADAALLGALVGQRVRAVGVLSFKPGVGIFLGVAEIDATKSAGG